jgi:hypothetical protein
VNARRAAYPDAVWIGPGATEHVPNAPGIAREAIQRVHGLNE